MGWIDQRGSEVLPRNECLRLLALNAGGVGRVALAHDGRVVIEPVNYRVLDDDIVLQVGPGMMLDAVDQGAVLTFEVDSVAPPTAWSVSARGPARRISPDLAAKALPARGAPLVRDPGATFARIRTDVVSGRRFEVNLS